MPFASKCCKCSKLLVDLFLKSYSNCTALNEILKNCARVKIAIYARNASEMCTETCRDLYNDIIDTCDATVSGLLTKTT